MSETEQPVIVVAAFFAEKVAPELAMRTNSIIADLDRAWNATTAEYEPTEGEAFAVALRYCHLFFNQFLKLGTFPLSPFAHREASLRAVLVVLDRCWEGEKYAGRYVIERGLDDAHVRELHATMIEMKTEAQKRNLWPELPS